MSRRQPTISVGMPVYNGERYLSLAIESVLDQTYGDFELIISDNASSDGTEDICRSYAAKDARIVYIRNEENIGAAGNYNQLFRRSVGEFFRWFNADDLSSRLLHEKCLAALLEHQDSVMSYGRTETIDSHGRLIRPYDDRLNLRQDSVADRFIEFFRVVGLTNAIYGLMRRSALAKTSLMGNGKFPSADTYLMAELVLQGKIIEIPETLFCRRMHEEASTWGKKDENVQQQWWLGNSGRFILPTLRREIALWQAVTRAPASGAEKRRMKKYLVRRIYWAKGEIAKETVRAVTARIVSAR